MNKIKFSNIYPVLALLTPPILLSILLSVIFSNLFAFTLWESGFISLLSYLIILLYLLIATSYSKKLSSYLSFLTQSQLLEVGQELHKTRIEYDRKNFILENISEGICAINDLGVIVFYNQKFYKKFIKPLQEGDSNPEPKELNLGKVFQNHDDIHQAFLRVLRKKTNESLRQISHFHKGREHFFDITISSVEQTDTTGYASVVGVFHDVTEKRLTDLMRVNFVANISHEIRTPLTSILGFSELLSNKSGEEIKDIKPFLKPIIDNAKKLKSLFADLLTLSLIESEKKIHKSTLSLEQLFDHQLYLLKANYPEKNVMVKKNIKIDTIEVDNDLFQQVLTNLLDNSLKYSKSNEVQIQVSSEIIVDKNNFQEILISLSDNNDPIPDSSLERIFERFFRLDSARNINYGSGIGLSIVKQILAKHRGKAYAINEQGKTIFCLTLPLSKQN